jgi:hypothetical protein
MKGGTRAALAIGVGYMLGRRRKMRTATILAAAAATGGLGGLGGSALQRGAKVLGSTETVGKLAPQLSELTQTMREDLVSAGKAAAVAAVSNRIESLSDSLRDRTEALRDPAASGEKLTRGLLSRRRGEEDEETEEPEDIRDEDYEDEEEPEPDEPEEPEESRGVARRVTSRRRSPVTRARR